MGKIKDCTVYVPEFSRYLSKEPCWGALHIVLDDFNYEDENVESCVQWARENRDAEGERLGLILLNMSVTQRQKVGRLAERLERA